MAKYYGSAINGVSGRESSNSKSKNAEQQKLGKKISKLEKKSQNCKIEKGNCKAGKNIQML